MRDAWGQRICAYRRGCIAIFLKKGEQAKCPDAAAGTLEEKAQALVDGANDSGGRDNISVILTQASDRQVRKGLLSRMLGR